MKRWLLIVSLLLSLAPRAFAQSIGGGGISNNAGGVMIPGAPATGTGQCATSIASGSNAAQWGSCGSGNLPTVPSGTGQALFNSSGSAAWSAFASGSDVTMSTSTAGLVNITHSMQTCTASSCTVTATFVLCNAASNAVTLNLPVAGGTGRPRYVKKTDSSGNACTVTANGMDTIDGAATLVLGHQYQAAMIEDAASGAWSIESRSYPVSQTLATHNFVNASNGGVLTGAQPASTDLSDLPIPISSGGTGSTTAAGTAGTGLAVSGSFPNQQYSLSTPVSVANGGTQCGAPSVYASLPGSPTNGEVCNVTDATACTAGTAVTVGGGSTHCQVTYNGTNWMPGGGVTNSGGGGVNTSSQYYAPYYGSSSTISGANVSGVPNYSGSAAPTALGLSGNATTLATKGAGSLTSGDLASWDPNGNAVDSGATTSTNVGTVNTGVQGNEAYYSGTSAIKPVANVYHAGTGTLAAAQANCSTGTAPCVIIGDPDQTYTVSSEFDLGVLSGSTQITQTLLLDGADIHCTGTSGLCIGIGNRGQLIGTGTSNGSGLGSVISGQSSSSLTAVVGEATPSGGTTQFHVQNVDIGTSGTTTEGALYVSSICGLAVISDVVITSFDLANYGIVVDDANSCLNVANFTNIWVNGGHASMSGAMFLVNAKSSGIRNVNCTMCSLVDAYGSGSYLELETSAGSAYADALTFHNLYLETYESGSNGLTGDVILANNVHNVFMDGVEFNAGVDLQARPTVYTSKGLTRQEWRSAVVIIRATTART
jgi:hypothetical protein